MTAALPINLIDLTMSKELDQSAMQSLIGGHSSGTSVKTSYYTRKQTQAYGFYKRHRTVRHYTRVTVQKWHSTGRWGRWHIHF